MQTNIKTLKPYKNHKNEWMFPEGSFEGDKFALFLKDGDLTPLLHLEHLPRASKVFISYLIFNENNMRSLAFHLASLHSRLKIKFYILDTCYSTSEIEKYVKGELEACIGEYNILPNWSPYIDKDSAVLFLSEEDYKKYKHILNVIFGENYNDYKNKEGKITVWQHGKDDYNSYSLIIPELHANGDPSQKELYPNLYCHIQNINNIAKELKEKCGAKRVELFVSHCFEPLFCKPIPCANNEIFYRTLSFSLNFDIIDKITTTNSTGVLEVQDSERLKVVDCLEFFD